MARRVAERIASLSWGRLLVVMAATFSLIHAGYYLAGVRFDGSELTRSYHLLDTRLLSTRLAESLLYLHSQPPLFNFVAGVVLKLSPHSPVLVFHLSYLLMGFVLYLVLFALMRHLGVPVLLSLGVSTWFMASPSFILYEHWLHELLPLTLLLAASCLLFARALARPRFGRLLAFFGIVLAACLLHATFHLVYFAAVMAALLALRWRRRRTILAAALVPLLVLLGLYVKNYVIFGVPGATSWLGLNVSGVTVRALPESARRDLVADGKLSPLALVPRMAPLRSFPARYRSVSGFEGIESLWQERKPSGTTNYNHLAYIGISRGDVRDARFVALHRPQYLLLGWLNSWLCYFRSGTDYGLVWGNLSRIAPVNVLYDYLCYGKVPWYRLRLNHPRIYFAGREPRLYLFLLVGLPLLVVFGIREARRERSGELALSREQKALLLYVCANIVFVALVGNACDVGENNRFRFATDPLYALLLSLAIQRYLARRRERRQTTAAAAPAAAPTA